MYNFHGGTPPLNSYALKRAPLYVTPSSVVMGLIFDYIPLLGLSIPIELCYQTRQRLYHGQVTRRISRIVITP